MGDPASYVRRRFLAAAPVLTTSVAAIAACSRGGEVATEPAGGAATRPAKIAVSFPSGPQEQIDVLTRRTRLFREQHPNVQVEEITGAGGSLNEKVLALFAAGTPPDLLTMNPAQAPAGGPEDLATRGMLLELDARIKQDRALRWDDLWPSARGAGQFEGKQLTLPSNGFYGALLFFNKEVFGAGGQPAPDQFVARKEWTWQTLAAGAARLTKREPTGELVQAGIGYPWFPKIWATMLLRAYGADYMDPAGTKLVIDSPRAVDALRVASEIASRQRAMALPRDGNIQQLVQGGRVAQSLSWMAAVSWWRPTGFDWDVAPAPRPHRGARTRPPPAGRTGCRSSRGTTPSGGGWTTACRAPTPRPRGCAAPSTGGGPPCGPSPTRTASSRPTPPPNGRCGRRGSGARAASAPRPTPAPASSSGASPSSPPASRTAVRGSPPSPPPAPPP